MLGLAWRFAAGYIVLPIEISSSRHNLVVALYAMPGGHCRTRKRRFRVRNADKQAKEGLFICQQNIYSELLKREPARRADKENWKTQL